MNKVVKYDPWMEDEMIINSRNDEKRAREAMAAYHETQRKNRKAKQMAEFREMFTVVLVCCGLEVASMFSATQGLIGEVVAEGITYAMIATSFASIGGYVKTWHRR